MSAKTQEITGLSSKKFIGVAPFAAHKGKDVSNIFNEKSAAAVKQLWRVCNFFVWRWRHRNSTIRQALLRVLKGLQT